MNKNTLKIAASGAALAAVVLSLSVQYVAFAQGGRESDDEHGDRQEMMRYGGSTGEQGMQGNDGRENENEMRMSDAPHLRVEPSGQFMASGLIVNANSASVSNGAVVGTLNVKLFGINFNVKVDNAKIEGGPASSPAVTDIAVGDKIAIMGSVDPSTGVITASRVVDRTLAARATGDIQSKIADLMRIVEQLREQLKQLGR